MHVHSNMPMLCSFQQTPYVRYHITSLNNKTKIITLKL
jgi:hypothetical protein